MLYVGDLCAADELFAGAAENRDDRPVIEFVAPRLTRMTAAGDKDWFTGEQLAGFYTTLEARSEARPDPVLPRSPEVALPARLLGGRTATVRTPGGGGGASDRSHAETSATIARRHSPPPDGNDNQGRK
jgi:hypothetical protein